MKGLFLSYKGICAFAYYHFDEKMYYGKIEGLKDLVTFGGETVEEATEDFKNAVEDYLSDEEYQYNGVSTYAIDLIPA